MANDPNQIVEKMKRAAALKSLLEIDERTKTAAKSGNKIFSVTQQKGNSRIIISEKPTGRFNASVVFYDRIRSKNPSSQDWGTIELKHHIETAATEAEAFAQAKNWIAKNIGPDFSVKEITQEEAEWEKKFQKFLDDNK
ncbi:MAG: hypothetical protein ABSG87_02165 [Verrucomicrobiota bacterium]|jgi:hypothetical protein